MKRFSGPCACGCGDSNPCEWHAAAFYYRQLRALPSFWPVAESCAERLTRGLSGRTAGSFPPITPEQIAQAVAREWQRLSPDSPIAVANIASVLRKLRADAGQLKACPECGNAFVSSRENRTICVDCKDHRRKHQDRERERCRLDGAARKQRARRIAKSPISTRIAIRREIDAILTAAVGENPKLKAIIGIDHVAECQKKHSRYRSRLRQFLLPRDEDAYVRLVALLKSLS